MSEDIVKRLRDAAEWFKSAGNDEMMLDNPGKAAFWDMHRDTASKAADRIESLERDLAEAKRLESAACKRLAEYNRDLQTAEQALASALKRLLEIGEIASWEERDKEAYIAQGPAILIRDMRRIATIASNNPNG